jgi:hypothetical protein
VSWIDTLKSRWKVKSAGQVIIILLVFACTGFTVVLIKRPIFYYVFNDGQRPLWFTIVYYIMILPFYNLFLLIYGVIFGQFQFFWDFEKRLFRRILGTKHKN